MAFPPSAYTTRGGVGAVAAHAKADAAREIERDAKVEGGGDDDQPDPAAPATVAVLPDDEEAPDGEVEPLPLAA